jgi:hypothetical protein
MQRWIPLPKCSCSKRRKRFGRSCSAARRHLCSHENVHIEGAERAFEMHCARGDCASSSRRTTSVTESPRCARQAPIVPPTPPAPGTACAIGALMRLLLLCGTRSNSAYAEKLGTKINFLFTNSSMPRLESSFPYPERLMPPKGSSGRLISG